MVHELLWKVLAQFPNITIAGRISMTTIPNPQNQFRRISLSIISTAVEQRKRINKTALPLPPPKGHLHCGKTLLIYILPVFQGYPFLPIFPLAPCRVN